MLHQRFIAFCVLTALCACGDVAPSDVFEANVATGLPPTVTRVAPTTAAVGSTVTIFGYGFSVIPTDDIVLIGGVVVPASTYDVATPQAAGEIEQLTVVIPVDQPVGATTLGLVVYDEASNNDVALTITP